MIKRTVENAAALSADRSGYGGVMKRLTLVVVVLAMVMGAGCEELKVPQLQKAPEAYWVMFDGPVNIFDGRVFHNGTAIGEIQSTETGPTLATRLAVTIAPEYRETITTSTVFVLSAGQLAADHLDLVGTPVAPGGVLMGFSSKGAFYWFKTQTLFSRTADEAAARARGLFAEMAGNGPRGGAVGH